MIEGSGCLWDRLLAAAMQHPTVKGFNNALWVLIWLWRVLGLPTARAWVIAHQCLLLDHAVHGTFSLFRLSTSPFSRYVTFIRSSETALMLVADTLRPDIPLHEVPW